MFQEYEQIIANRYPHLKYKQRGDFFLYSNGVYRILHDEDFQSIIIREMAKDGLFLKKAANLNSASVPEWALWVQCVWASVLCLTGKYGDLLDFVIIIVLIFYILTIYGIFILRKKMPEAERPYKAFGYPFLPLVYIVIASAVCISLLITKFSTCGWGVLIMLTGIPIYYATKPKE